MRLRDLVEHQHRNFTQTGLLKPGDEDEDDEDDAAGVGEFSTALIASEPPQRPNPVVAASDIHSFTGPQTSTMIGAPGVSAIGGVTVDRR